MFIVLVQQTEGKGFASNHGFTSDYLAERAKSTFNTLENAAKAANELAKRYHGTTFQVFEYIEAYKANIEKV